MTDTQHTPGPWKPLEKNFQHRVATGDGRFPICTIDRWPGESDQEGANARLIAAAPELLEVLKAVLKLGIFKHVEETRGVGAYACRNGLWDKAQSAITKAEGK